MAAIFWPGGPAGQFAHTAQPIGLLRACGKRPRRRTAEKGDELASLHVPPVRTTPSAMPNNNRLRPGGE